jgi:hypothetical protein
MDYLLKCQKLHICPNCKFDSILEFFDFCPSCGFELLWDIEIIEGDEEYE